MALLGKDEARTGSHGAGSVTCTRPGAKTNSADWLDRLCGSLNTSINKAFAETSVWKGHLIVSWLSWDDAGPRTTGTSSGVRSLKSPLLLLPVRLLKPEKGSASRRWHVTSTGDRGVRLNNALRFKLKEEFGVTLPELDPLPSDASQMAIKKWLEDYESLIISSVRTAGISAAIVSDPAKMLIGELGFTGESVYEDITKRADAIVESRAFRGIWEHSQELTPVRVPSSSQYTGRCGVLFGLDETQEHAVARVLQGQSVVVQGPPGTGKSQTIAALIVELMRQGKTVLFVAEKQAAVDAVTKRLREKGLDDYVANLHSADLRPGSVYGHWSESAHAITAGAPPGSGSAGSRLDAVEGKLARYFLFVRDTLEGFGASVLDLAGSFQKYSSLVAGAGAADLYASTKLDLLDLGASSWRNIVRNVESRRFNIGRGIVVLASDKVWEGLRERDVPHLTVLRHARAVREAAESLELAVKNAVDEMGGSWGDKTRGGALLDGSELLIEVLSGSEIGLSVSAVGASTGVVWDTGRELFALAEGLGKLRTTLTTLRGSRDASELYERHCHNNDAELLLSAPEEPELLDMLVANFPEAYKLFVELDQGLSRLDTVLDDLLSPADKHRVRHLDLTDLREQFRALEDLQSLGVAEQTIERRSARDDFLAQVDRLIGHVEHEGVHAERLGDVFDITAVREDSAGFRDAVDAYKTSRALSSSRRRAERRLCAYTTSRKWGRKSRSALPEVEEWLHVLQRAEGVAAELRAGHRVTALNEAAEWGLSPAIVTAHAAIRALASLKDVKDAHLIGVAAAEVDHLYELVGALSLRYDINVATSDSAAQVASRLPRLRDSFSRLQAAHECVELPNNRLTFRAVYLANDAALERRLFMRHLVQYFEGGGSDLAPLGELGHLVKGLTSLDAVVGIHQQLLRLAGAVAAIRDPQRYAWIVKNPEPSRTGGLLADLRAAHVQLVAALQAADSECLARVEVSHRELLDFLLVVQEEEALEEKLAHLRSAADDVSKVCAMAPDDSLAGLRDYVLSHRGARALLESVSGDVIDPDSMVQAALLAPLLRNTWNAVHAAAAQRFVDEVDYMGDSAQLNALLEEYRDLERQASKQELVSARAEMDRHRHQRLSALLSDPASKSGAQDGRRFIDRYGQRGQRQNSRTKIREALARPSWIELMTSITPCFIASPESASTYLPMDFTFDVLVFDEASQILPIRAAACLGRAESVVVAGDTRQLPPTNFFQVSYDEEDDSAEEDTYDDSLLDLAGKSAELGLVASSSLLWHYRSRHDGLIRFSNEHFYGGRLQWFPACDRDASSGGVQFHHLSNSVYHGGGVNETTARASLELAIDELKRGSSVGIVAFSKKQADLIEQISFNEFFEDLSGVDRDDPTSGFFVKNLENVQGDERDVIILDFPYGKKDDGSFSLQFGPLSRREYGERRLNVAITRARTRMHVVSGVTALDFGMVNAESGAGLLRDFLMYAENPPHPRQPKGAQETESIFEEQVLEFVEAAIRRLSPTRPLEVHTQIGCRGYRIDMALYDVERKRYILGIECDGAAYHSSRHARSRDRIRHEQITAMGWTLYHVWGGSWFSRRDAEARALEKRIADVLQPAGRVR